MTQTTLKTLPKSRSIPALQLIGFLAFVILGGFAGYAIGKLVPRDLPVLSAIRHLSKGESVWFIIAVVVILHLVLLVHECGHLLAGKVARFRFFLLIVGPLHLERRDDKFSVRWNTNLVLWGGLAGSSPIGEEHLRRRMAIFTAGGPGASFLLALVSLMPVAMLHIPESALLIAICYTTAILSGLIGVVTLIPVHTGGFYSDGSRLLMLLRGGPSATRWMTSAIIVNQYQAGIQPKDWHLPMLEEAVNYQDHSSDDASIAMLLYYALLGRGETVRAAEMIERSLASVDTLPTVARPLYLLEGAYFAAFYQHDAATARALLGAVGKPGPLGDMLQRRTMIALALLDGNNTGARTLLEEAQTAMKRLSGQNLVWERVQLEQLESALDRLSAR